MAVAVLLCCVGVAITSWWFFFGAPIAFSFVAVVWSAVLVAQLVQARRVQVRPPAAPQSQQSDVISA